MNRKQVLVLLVVVAIVGVAGLMVHNRQNQERRSANLALGKKLLPDLQVNNVAHIRIQQGTNEVNLIKQPEDVWRVTERSGYPANYQEISGFLLKARDLKVVQNEQVGPSQLPRLGLTTADAGTNNATVVEMKDAAGKEISTLLLGKKHMRKSNRPSPMGDLDDQGWPDGRYVRLASEKSSVALISDPLNNIEAKPDQWINKDFFKLEKVKSVAVTFLNPTNSWKLERESESGDWMLATAKPEESLDKTKASGAAGAFNYPSFTDVAPTNNLESFGLSQPTFAEFETFDGFSYSLKIGQKTNDGYPIMVAVSAKLPEQRAPGKDEKAEDKEKLDKDFQARQDSLRQKLQQEKSFGNWVYLVSTWSIESLLKERGQLMEDKKEEQKTATSTEAPPESHEGHSHGDSNDSLIPEGLPLPQDQE